MKKIFSLSVLLLFFASSGTVFGTFAGVETQQISAGAQVSVFPNPAQGVFNIIYAVSSDVEQSQVQISIYNLVGKEVAQLVNEQQSPGEYQRQFKISSDLARGIYFVKVDTGNSQSITRLLIE